MEDPSAQRAPDIPVYASRFIGRRRELAEVTACLARVRCLTLVGPAGAGKTRLALEVAAQIEGSGSERARLVELGSLTEASLLPEAFASAFNLPEDGSRALVDVLIGRLSRFQGVIVVDNCEHLVEACAQLVDRILRRCPGVKVLATSREALHIDGETVWPVATMACPREGASLLETRRSEAVQLFVERAQMAVPAFELNQSNADEVAAICRRLDGLPLAIELAAARVAMLDLKSIHAQLRDRFRFLTEGFRAAPARQRTLRAAIDWSYELLTAAERQLCARVSVFSGGFDLQAAEKVCSGGAVIENQVLELLGRLISKSLVQTTDQGRYRQLESLREYGADRLRDAVELENWNLQHARYFASQASDGSEGQEGPPIGLIAPTEIDNMREALAWSRLGDRRLHLVLAVAFGWFCCRSGYPAEGRSWLEPAVDHGADDQVHAALAYRVLSILAWRQDDGRAAERFAADEVRLRRTMGDERMLASSLGNLAHIQLEFGRFDDAASAVYEETRIADRLGDRGLKAEALFHAGFLEATQNDLVAARAHLVASVALHEQAGRNAAYVNLILGWVLLMLRDLYAARLVVNKVTTARWRSQDVGFLPASFDASAEIAFLDGALERAMRLKGAADSIRERGGASARRLSVASHNRWVTRAERALGSAAQSAWQEGGRWTVEDAVRYALAPSNEPPRMATDVPEGRLSTREMQIAELVATGLSNGEVAAKLHLSRRTVDAHLEHIRTKLGARSRVDVATWVTARAAQSSR